MSIRTTILLVFLTCTVSLVSARAILQAATCPISPTAQQLDFSGLATGCGDATQACTSCVCAVNEAFLPAFKASGITFDPENPKGFNVTASNLVLRSCVPTYLQQVLAANVDLQPLTALETNCPDGIVPECLPAILASLQGNTTSSNVTTTSSNTTSSNATTSSNDVTTSSNGTQPSTSSGAGSGTAPAAPPATRNSASVHGASVMALVLLYTLCTAVLV